MTSPSIKTAPYGPPGNVLTVVQRLRNHGVPNPLASGELERLGIPEGNISRTAVALKFLGLTEDDGTHTEAMNRLMVAPSDQYQAVFADIVRAAYRDIFSLIKPETATEDDITNAFRPYAPTKQRSRMAILFKGLCREAGLMPGDAPSPTVRRAPKTTAAPARTTAAPPAANGGTKSEYPAPAPPPFDGPAADWVEDWRAVFAKLPTNGVWTADKRNRWLAAVQANVDLFIDVIDDEGQP